MKDQKNSGKNERFSNEHSKPLISSTDIKSALRDYLNTELGNKNNSISKLKSNSEDLRPRDSNEKVIPNNGSMTDSKKDPKIDPGNLLNSKNFTVADRELLDRIRHQEGKGGYIKSRLRR